jgi:hypothetical protein
MNRVKKDLLFLILSFFIPFCWMLCTAENQQDSDINLVSNIQEPTQTTEQQDSTVLSQTLTTENISISTDTTNESAGDPEIIIKEQDSFLASTASTTPQPQEKQAISSAIKTIQTTQSPKTQQQIIINKKQSTPKIQDPFNLEQMKIAEKKRTLLKSKLAKTKPTNSTSLQNWRKQKTAHRAKITKTPVARNITQQARKKAQKIIASKKSARFLAIKPATSRVSSKKIKSTPKKQPPPLTPKKPPNPATQAVAPPITGPVTQPEKQPAKEPITQPTTQPEIQLETPSSVTETTTEQGDPEIGSL